MGCVEDSYFTQYIHIILISFKDSVGCDVFNDLWLFSAGFQSIGSGSVWDIFRQRREESWL